MRKLPFASKARISTALLAVCLLVTVSRAQNPPSTSSSAVAPAQTPAQSHPATKANDAMLARAGKLYYSTAKYGLTGFDCAVVPNWLTFIQSAQPGVAFAADDPRILLLKSVKITLHARMKGDSTVDWTPLSAPGTPLDKNSTDILDAMHQATEQSLQGFLEFWIPFMDGSAVPSSSEGLEIAKTDKGYTIHAEQAGTSVTEEIDNQLLINHYSVVMDQSRVNFAPTYKPTDKGLLVNGFLAHILPAGSPPDQVQEMHVSIEYQSVSGDPIPARLKLSVVNREAFDYVFDNCTVNRQTK
jgi:hypothetical protein